MLITVLYAAFLALPALAVAVYYAFLLVARLLGASAVAPEDGEARAAFAVLIPAHDEERVLPRTLASCAALDYPADRFRVVVVADNCTDKTAEVARAAGAQCLERQDASQRGKGHALAWALPRLLAEPVDAVLVLDADCRLTPNALRVFDAELERGHDVVQADHVVTNVDASPIAYVNRVGELLEYEMFYAPKSDLGLAVFLAGTGMMLHRRVLEAHPWDAFSAAEDTEYSIHLLREGHRIRLASNVDVLVDAAVDATQLTVQRDRWAQGLVAQGRRSVFRLMGEAVRRANLRLFDAAWTLLVLSRALVFSHLALALLVGGALTFTLRPQGIEWAWAAAGVALLLHGLVLLTGILRVGLTPRRVGLLLASPWVMGRLVLIALRAVLHRRRAAWTKTPRDAERDGAA